MPNVKTLADTLRDQLQVKGLTLDRIRRETGITDRYLVALFDGAVDKLPAAPYVRGYLVRLAHTLDLDPNDLWKLYQESAHVRSSGAEDRMPENRFALKHTPRSWIIGGVIATLLAIYLGVNIPKLLGRPELTVTNPGPETTIVTLPSIVIDGTTDPESTLTVNGEHVTVLPSGAFRTDYTLESGLNHIEITSVKLLGRAASVVREVVYQPLELFPLSE
jgi:cytoskeletal protein RodZ